MKDSELINLASIDKKMNVIISLLSKMSNGSEQTLKNRIAELSEFGLSTNEIAPIVGKKADVVSKELYKIKIAKKIIMENKDLLESISKRLGVLIALKINEQAETNSIARGVELLTRFGLSPTDIAEILNTSVNTVNVTRTRLKKNKKK